MSPQTNFTVLELTLFSPDYVGSFGESLLALGKTLKEKGSKVIVCFPVWKDWMNIFKRRGFLVELLPIKNIIDFTAVSKLLSLIKRYKVDIIHTHFGLETQVVAAIAKILYNRQLQLVWHWRSPPRTDVIWKYGSKLPKLKAGIKRSLGSILYRIIDLVCVDMHIVISSGIYDILLSRRISIPEKLKRVYNAIDIDRFDPEKTEGIRDKLGIGTDQILIGNISNFRPQKDHFTFLNAAKIVLDKSPDTRFMLVGYGPTQQKVEEYAERLDLMNNLIFTGMQKDVAPFIASCDFTVLSTNYEGFGNVICESMALKKPVVATDVGGVSEIIEDRKTGFLTPRKDAKSMAKKIFYLIEHPEEVKRMGEKGRKFVEQKFAIKRWIKKIVSIYENLLN